MKTPSVLSCSLQANKGAGDTSRLLLLFRLREAQCGDCCLPPGQVSPPTGTLCHRHRAGAGCHELAVRNKGQKTQGVHFSGETQGRKSHRTALPSVAPGLG